MLKRLQKEVDGLRKQLSARKEHDFESELRSLQFEKQKAEEDKERIAQELQQSASVRANLEEKMARLAQMICSSHTTGEPVRTTEKKVR